MLLIHEVDKPGSDIDEYIECLESILNHKLEEITTLKSKVSLFRQHLKKEEILSKKFYE
jgi:kinesin family protein 2/24